MHQQKDSRKKSIHWFCWFYFFWLGFVWV